MRPQDQAAVRQLLMGQPPDTGGVDSSDSMGGGMIAPGAPAGPSVADVANLPLDTGMAHFQPPQGALPPPSRAPGGLKKLLLNFTYNLGENLSKSMGMESYSDIQQKDMMNALTLRKAVDEHRMQQAQIANLAEDNRRMAAENAAKDAARAAHAESPAEAIARKQREALAGGLNPAETMEYVYGIKHDKPDTSTSELEGYMRLLGPQAGLAKYNDVLTQRARAGKSVTNVGTNAPDVAIGSSPLKNPNEEHLAQMRAAGKYTDQGLKALYPGAKNAAALQRITLRAAGLKPGGNLNEALNPQAQKAMIAAHTAKANLDKLQSIIRSNKLENSDSDVLFEDRLRYTPLKVAGVTVKAGYAPKTELGKHMAGLNFGALQSAAALMSQTGSRAWQTLQEALKHPPTWNDTPKQMMIKADDIREKLQDAIRETQTYGTKSGLPTEPPPTNGNGGGAPAAAPGWESIFTKSRKAGAR